MFFGRTLLRHLPKNQQVIKDYRVSPFWKKHRRGKKRCQNKTALEYYRLGANPVNHNNDASLERCSLCLKLLKALHWPEAMLRWMV